MFGSFYFSRTRLRYIRAAILAILTYRPDGKDAAFRPQKPSQGSDASNALFQPGLSAA